MARMIGKIKRLKKKYVNCPSCDSMIEFSNTDKIVYPSFDIKTNIIYCPACNKKIYLDARDVYVGNSIDEVIGFLGKEEYEYEES